METKDKILIVEDDDTIAAFLVAVLNANGFDTIRAGMGREAVSLISSHCPDLVLLDLSLPDMDGMDILSGLRKWSTLPVIVVSARGRERDKVIALDMGADDYLTKPFSADELFARVRALSRRKGEVVICELSFGDIVLSLSAYNLTCGTKSVHLGGKEFEIMRVLMLNRGLILSKETLINKIWGGDSDVMDNNVEAYVSFLRKKLGFLGSCVQICSARKQGYYLSEGDDGRDNEA